MEISVERYHWGLLLSTIYQGYLVQHKYMGYTVKEAREDFKQNARLIRVSN